MHQASTPLCIGSVMNSAFDKSSLSQTRIHLTTERRELIWESNDPTVEEACGITHGENHIADQARKGRRHMVAFSARCCEQIIVAIRFPAYFRCPLPVIRKSYSQQHRCESSQDVGVSTFKPTQSVSNIDSCAALVGPLKWDVRLARTTSHPERLFLLKNCSSEPVEQYKCSRNDSCSENGGCNRTSAP